MAVKKSSNPSTIAAAVNPATVRASRREPLIGIDLASDDLKSLMVEQCRTSEGHVTVYRGSMGELVAAGIPAAAFSKGAASTAFRIQTLNCCCTGSYERLRGSITVLAPDSYEIEVQWGGVTPYFQGEHPAIGELSRQILLSLDWIDRGDLKAPIDELCQIPDSAYRPAAGITRVQLTPEFMDRLRNAISSLCNLVHQHGEVVLSAAPESGSAARPTLRLVGGTEAKEVPHA